MANRVLKQVGGSPASRIYNKIFHPTQMKEIRALARATISHVDAQKNPTIKNAEIFLENKNPRMAYALIKGISNLKTKMGTFLELLKVRGGFGSCLEGIKTESVETCKNLKQACEDAKKQDPNNQKLNTIVNALDKTIQNSEALSEKATVTTPFSEVRAMKDHPLVQKLLTSLLGNPQKCTLTESNGVYTLEAPGGNFKKNIPDIGAMGKALCGETSRTSKIKDTSGYMEFTPPLKFTVEGKEPSQLKINLKTDSFVLGIGTKNVTVASLTYKVREDRGPGVELSFRTNSWDPETVVVSKLPLFIQIPNKQAKAFEYLDTL